MNRKRHRTSSILFFACIILNSFEITRRGCWNFLKVENKHIDISNEFKVTNDVELPFVKVNGKYVNNESN